MNAKRTGPLQVLLADDDDDDRLLFLDVLKELPVPVNLSFAANGEIAMDMLSKSPLPNLVFLDLNMPLKNGFECLEEIRADARMRDLPVIIFSTSSQPSAIDQVYRRGAQLYIRKPNDFTQLKKVINHVITRRWGKDSFRPRREEFVLTI
jgi:CheY-like chemotaxis protein